MSYSTADLFDALGSAGADDAVARKASESVRAPDQLISWCLSAVGLREAVRMDGLDKRLGMMMWMVGCTIGLYALLFRALP